VRGPHRGRLTVGEPRRPPDAATVTSLVVVGVGGGARAWGPVSWAASYASGIGATVELLSCWRPGQVEVLAAAGWPPRFVGPEDAARTRLQLLLDRLRTQDPGAAVTLTLATGRVSDALAAASLRAALLVLGSRPRPGWAQALTGSTSARVARLAGCPVVSVCGTPVLPARLPAEGIRPLGPPPGVRIVKGR